MALADTNHGGDSDVADSVIFDAVHVELRRYAVVVGSLGEDPDDLVQEAVTRALRKGSLADLDNPSAYLRRVISNLVVDGVRHDVVKKRQAHLVAGEVEALDHYPSDLDILEQLSPIERAILLLVDIDGLRFDELSRIVGVSQVAARLRASRARKHCVNCWEITNDGATAIRNPLVSWPCPWCRPSSVRQPKRAADQSCRRSVADNPSAG